MSERMAEESPSRMSKEQLVRKVRWEGGLVEALEYGIGADDIEDPELAIKWAELADAYEEFRPLRDAMARRLAVE